MILIAAKSRFYLITRQLKITCPRLNFQSILGGSAGFRCTCFHVASRLIRVATLRSTDLFTDDAYVSGNRRKQREHLCGPALYSTDPKSQRAGSTRIRGRRNNRPPPILHPVESDRLACLACPELECLRSVGPSLLTVSSTIYAAVSTGRFWPTPAYHGCPARKCRGRSARPDFPISHRSSCSPHVTRRPRLSA